MEPNMNIVHIQSKVSTPKKTFKTIIEIILQVHGVKRLNLKTPDPKENVSKIFLKALKGRKSRDLNPKCEICFSWCSMSISIQHWS